MYVRIGRMGPPNVLLLFRTPAWRIRNQVSTRSPDSLRHPPSPETALTLAEVHVAGWMLTASCARCSLTLRVSTATLIKSLGPDAVAWGLKTPCPRANPPCGGELTYTARAIAGGSAKPLVPAPARVLETWKAKRGSLWKPPR